MSVKKLPPIKQPSNVIVAKIQHKEAKRKRLIAAIEPKSGDYFLGKSTLEAVRKGREKYPGTVFYCIRIGYPAVHELRGYRHCSNSRAADFCPKNPFNIFRRSWMSTLSLPQDYETR